MASSSAPHVSTARQLGRLPGERANGAATVAAALRVGLPRRKARVALRVHARRIEDAAAGPEARSSSGGRSRSRRGDAAVCAAAGQVAGRSAAGVWRGAGMEVVWDTCSILQVARA